MQSLLLNFKSQTIQSCLPVNGFCRSEQTKTQGTQRYWQSHGKLLFHIYARPDIQRQVQCKMHTNSHTQFEILTIESVT